MEKDLGTDPFKLDASGKEDNSSLWDGLRLVNSLPKIKTSGIILG